MIGVRVTLLGACLSLSAALLGCGGPRAIPIPAYTPAKMAAEALALYDTNKDGKIDAQELKACSALADGLAAIDTNKDKAIDAGELTERFEGFQKSGVGLIDVRGKVTRGNTPVANVTVELQPEKFMGTVVKPAVGTSTPSGDVIFRVAGEDLPGIQLGYYRIVATLKDNAGKNSLDEKYNVKTTLGKEISAADRQSVSVDLSR